MFIGKITVQNVKATPGNIWKQMKLDICIVWRCNAQLNYLISHIVFFIYIYPLPHLFSMASMFLSSSKTCRELPSSLSEKSRWWPVIHRVPLLGGCRGCRSTTSSTLAVLICSENSISSSSSRSVPALNFKSLPRLSLKKMKAKLPPLLTLLLVG